MIIKKYVTGLIGLFLCTFSLAQNPSQTDMLNYIKSMITVAYIGDFNTEKPDTVIREVKTGRIEGLPGNIIFGQKDNNGMDITALLLRDLFTVKNGDIQFQQTMYDALKKIGRPIEILFINDVAVNIEKQYLRAQHFYYYVLNDKNYIWPASYTRAKPVFVTGEFISKHLLLAKELLTDLLINFGKGNVGMVSLTGKQGDGIENIVKYAKDIPQITSDQQAKWIRADMKQLGVIGNDWDGPDEIGTAPVEREMDLGLVKPQVLNFWYPNIRTQDNNKAWKRTMIGKMKEDAEHFENDFVFPDHDIDFYVIPDKDYEYLIKENPKPSTTFLSSIGNLKDKQLPHCPPVHDHVEGEIDLDDANEKQFLNFFNEEMKQYPYAGFYGTWMYDRGHCDHPEIHPAEQIWWSRRTENVYTYRCNLVCDYSGRYNTDQFDSEGGKYSIGKPWAGPPVSGVFAISFTLKPGRERLVYRIFQHDYNNLNGNKTVSFDRNKLHHYILNDMKVITVVEPDKKCMNVKFEDVAFDRAGNLTGFIVLTSSVGSGNEKFPSPGHLFFEVKRSIFKGTPAPPGKIKISLESIECTGVDDGHDAEKIIGAITCKSFSTKDSVSYRSQRLNPAANTVTSLCKGDLETLFCYSCPNWLPFRKNQKTPFTSSLTYDFPDEGYIEVTGDLDKGDSNNCNDLNYLGKVQKTYVLTDEVGTTPYKFTQFFASGKTIIKANFSAQRVR